MLYNEKLNLKADPSPTLLIIFPVNGARKKTDSAADPKYGPN